MLIGGIDDGKPVLFETDPTGIYFEYRASVIGEGEPIIEDFLHKNYKQGMTLAQGFKLGIKALSKMLDKSEFDINRIDGAYIAIKDAKFKKFSRDQIKEGMDEVMKK